MKAKLEAIKQGDTNAYNHLIQVLRQIILNNDKNSYQLFQYYSQSLKQGHHQSDNFRNQELQELVQYAKSFKGLLNKPNVGSEEQPAEPGPCGYLSNLMEQAKLFEKGGVGFGQQLTYIIFKAIERFCVIKQIKQVKFWGKILGRQRDYYILQAAAEGGQEGQLPPDVEPKGTGINKNTYWVATDLLNGQWKQLPLITPDQLNTSRKIKYIFTGDLQKIVYTNPHFKGKQAHLLKCQIVRISFNCQIVPRTMFNVNAEDKKEIQPAGQEWKLPNFTFLSSLDNWVHHPQNILLNGRLTLLKPNIPQGVEVDEEKLMKQLQAKDPLEQRLKPLSKDKFGSNSAWSIRVIGDYSQYKAMTKNKDTVNYGYICIKSLVWKGWTLVFHNKQWSSIYIGQGHKSNSTWYYPKQPEIILQQCKDRNEQNQPNFPIQQNKPKEEVAAEE